MRFVGNLIVDSNVAYLFIFGIDYFTSKDLIILPQK